MGTTPAAAESAADFFKGKTITDIVASGPNRSTDIYGRLAAKYMQKYIPGSKFVVENVPSPRQVSGANRIYAAKPGGLTIGIFTPRVVYEQFLGRMEVRFDLGKMTFIGKGQSDPLVFRAGADSKYRSFDDLRRARQPIKVGVMEAGTSNHIDAVLTSTVLRLDVEIIPDYGTPAAAKAGIERGEIDATVDKRRYWESFVVGGVGQYLFQMGVTDNRRYNLEGIPLLGDLVSEEDRSLVALIRLPMELKRLTAGPPGIPADRAAVLVDAYRKAMADPNLLAEFGALRKFADFQFGDNLRQRVVAALNQSPEKVAMVTTVYNFENPLATVKTRLLTIRPAVGGKGKVITFNDSNGKLTKSLVGGTRTTITIDGHAAERFLLAEGMDCTITYETAGRHKASEVVPHRWTGWRLS
ncbi:MAG: tripartite tricarboxylate transporter substrate-binding protein [Alphaproteobacteria bacterium]|nr:tripartite tricarboxylate transporter substrate-binding protein [Alphaproteobacteria bacterium]